MSTEQYFCFNSILTAHYFISTAERRFDVVLFNIFENALKNWPQTSVKIPIHECCIIGDYLLLWITNVLTRQKNLIYIARKLKPCVKHYMNIEKHLALSKLATQIEFEV